MTKTTVVCDKCDAEIPLSIVVDDRTYRKNSIGTGAMNVDLCDACEDTMTVSELRRFMQDRHKKILAAEVTSRS